MKKHRNIPFGYQVIDGRIAINQQEAEIVRYIFCEYLSGRSCQTIAKELSGRGILYRESADTWNGSVLKRILDNRRYVGNDGYPELVTADKFDGAAQLKAEKYTRKNITRPPAVPAIKSRIFCFECGTAFNRLNDTRHPTKWYCLNRECQTDFKITDDLLISGILAIFNEVIADPSILDISDNNTFISSLDIMRLNNEINLEMEKRELDSTRVKAMIMECAAKKYECCEDDPASFSTDKLKSEFEDRSPLTGFDAELFNRTVEAVLIEKNGMIHLRYKNSKEIIHTMREEVKM
jgi:site-specific DNA recombinase